MTYMGTKFILKAAVFTSSGLILKLVMAVRKRHLAGRSCHHP